MGGHKCAWGSCLKLCLVVLCLAVICTDSQIPYRDQLLEYIFVVVDESFSEHV